MDFENAFAVRLLKLKRKMRHTTYELEVVPQKEELFLW